MRPARSSAALALCAVAFAALPALAQEPALTTPLPRITADDELHWTVPFGISNPLSGGLYMDSLWCEIQDLDAGGTAAAGTTRLPLQHLLRILPNLSAGESGYFQYDGPAMAERAKLTFHLLTHDAAHQAHDLVCVVEAGPGPLSERYASRFLTVGGRQVEYVLIPSLKDTSAGAGADRPGLMLIGDESESARRMLRDGLVMAHRGYTTLLLSAPGYGRSRGPADFMGPATLGAATAALELLEKTPGVDPRRVAVWGKGRGATVAMELATRRAELAAVIAQSGLYDLWAAWRGAQDPAVRAAIRAEAGTDSSAWRLRSPALDPAAVHAPVLLLHGERDESFPVAQARSFAAALTARGADVNAQFLPEGTAALPLFEVVRLAYPFLDQRLHP